ncbi:hypothetical protein HOLleu_26484 [Holothuria leucospilota]|uniref:Uncharacterized protein n=1 Tax=Holothuria leucospilota TaxID=206669 RepID=A0A9Q1BP99_HOLLE|nr:hypothetical protein HOLleu_26484 [Holothuria leucospilota]
MGQTIGGIVKGVLGRNEIKDDPEKAEKVKDWLMQQNEKIEMKLKQFYSDIVIETTGKGQTPTVPICSVVDKVEHTYVYNHEKSGNVLQKTIGNVVDNALEGKWTESIGALVHGGLESFFGPSEISTSGETKETRKYHVVWCNNALIRIDVFLTQTSLSQVIGSSASRDEAFGGYIMVISVVDIEKIHNQVLIYEFSKFINQIKKGNKNAIAELKKDIEDEKEVLELLSTLNAGISLMKEGGAFSDAATHPAVLNKALTKNVDNDDEETNENNDQNNGEDSTRKENNQAASNGKRKQANKGGKGRANSRVKTS